MVSKSFIVKNGLTVGSTTIDAATGNIVGGGSVAATSFIGPGTGLTGTAAAFNIGGTAVSLAAGVAGSVPYQSAASTTAFSAAGTAGQVFTSNGASAPTWTTPATGGGSVTVADDTATNAIFYPTLSSATSGTVASVKTSSGKLQFNPSSGTLFATIFQSLSDQSLKTNVLPITDASAIIEQLQGVGYDWVDGSGGAQFGFIAQEVEQVIPAIVGFTGEFKTVNYSGVIPFLVEAFKQQTAVISALEARLALLEGE